jgi:hypothetical protein
MMNILSPHVPTQEEEDEELRGRPVWRKFIGKLFPLFS